MRLNGINVCYPNFKKVNNLKHYSVCPSLDTLISFSTSNFHYIYCGKD